MQRERKPPSADERAQLRRFAELACLTAEPRSGAHYRPFLSRLAPVAEARRLVPERTGARQILRMDLEGLAKSGFVELQRGKSQVERIRVQRGAVGRFVWRTVLVAALEALHRSQDPQGRDFTVERIKDALGADAPATWSVRRWLYGQRVPPISTQGKILSALVQESRKGKLSELQLLREANGASPFDLRVPSVEGALGGFPWRKESLPPFSFLVRVAQAAGYGPLDIDRVVAVWWPLYERVVFSSDSGWRKGTAKIHAPHDGLVLYHPEDFCEKEWDG